MNDSSNTSAALVERVTALGEAQRALLARRLAASSNGASTSTTSHPTLVAHFVARSGRTPTTESLRAHLAARLPAYMVPARLVAVDALPRTAAGKLDRRALTLPAGDVTPPAQAPGDDSESQGPNTEAERVLSQIWMEVLGLSEVGIDENFFELGGDSLLSIRILSRATRQGLRISPELFFAQPTIAAQARAASNSGDTHAERPQASGALPLPPVHHRFFQHTPEHPEHSNRCCLFELSTPLAVTTAERAVQTLMHHHDALRLRFDVDARSARIVLADSRVPVSHADLRACDGPQLDAGIERIATRLNASLDLANGPLLQVALINTPAALPDRLLLVAHQLLADDLSWQILVDDLQTAFVADESGQPMRLPAKTTSFERWCQALVEQAQSDAVRSELSYWQDVCAQPAVLPRDHAASADRNLVSTTRTHNATLSADTTATVLEEAASAFRATPQKLLLSALATSLARWCGTGPLRLDVQTNDREVLAAGMDVSRTIGCFAAVHPVCLDLLADDDPLAALDAVRTRAAGTPNDGLGHGLLSELCEAQDMHTALRGVPSQLLFNYVGRTPPRDSGRLVLLRDGLGTPRAPDTGRAYLVEVTVSVVGEMLHMDWRYSEAFHRASTIAMLAEGFTQAITGLANRASGGARVAARPDDFPLAGLDQDDLDGIADALGED